MLSIVFNIRGLTIRKRIVRDKQRCLKEHLDGRNVYGAPVVN